MFPSGTKSTRTSAAGAPDPAGCARSGSGPRSIAADTRLRGAPLGGGGHRPRGPSPTLAYNPPRDARRSPPRPRPVRPPGLRPVRRGSRRPDRAPRRSARRAGLAVPALVERDIETDPDWQRAYFATIPVVELGDRRLELATSAGQAAPPPDRRPGRLTGPMSGTDLTILVALAAGVISFLSPCVLPLVPAYLGQLTAIAVAGSADGRAPVALARGASRARLRRRVRRRVHGARDHRDVRRRPARRLPAGAPHRSVASS